MIASYLFGGVPVGLLVGRAKGIDDIRKYGSGNIGASNVLRVIGTKAGLFVWFADALKGFIPVAIAQWALGLPAPVVGVVAVAAMVGHCFSPYLRLTGGRGVSTSLGVIIGLNWAVGLICFAVWMIVVAVTRYISLGSMVGCALAAPLMLLFGDTLPEVIAAAVIALIVIIRHAPNIGRLLSGTERKIGQREKLAEPENEATPVEDRDQGITPTAGGRAGDGRP
ncbi:MAG: glycerol-3-phosphate 1-O-acyltransferase PlsY [Armatimonadota bacterium]